MENEPTVDTNTQADANANADNNDGIETVNIENDECSSKVKPIIIDTEDNKPSQQSIILEKPIEVIKMRTGLNNTGNNCFINSAIQCLAVSPFIHTFLKHYRQDDTKMISIINKYSLGKLKSDEMPEYIEQLIKNNPDINPEEQRTLKHVAKHSGDIFIYTCFKELIRNLNARNHKTISCGTLISVSQDISQSTGFEHLFSGEQNDPHEFMAFLLDKIHNAKSKPANIGFPPNYDSIDEYFKLYFKHLRARYQNDYTLFVKTFYYYILNCIECNQCNKSSIEVSPNDIMCVSLPNNWQTNNHITLEQCINEMFKVEGIEYKCEHCNNKDNNRMERKLITKPRTLIIKIKRYAQIGRGIAKINKMIHYPETLNLSQYLCGSNMEDYHLYGVINHIGMMGGGHYYSYVKDYEYNYNDSKGGNDAGKFADRWYLCNDSNVREMPFDEVMTSQNAYMLFYHSNN